MQMDPNRHEGSSTATGRSGRTAERSGAGASVPLNMTPSEALAELMPGLSAGTPADAGAPVAVSAAFVKPGRVSFFNSAFAVFLIALIVRLAFAWSGLSAPEETRFFRPDTDSYLAPAFTLTEIGEYRGVDGALTAHRTPGLPAFLAFFLTFSGLPDSPADTGFLSVILLFLGALTVFPVYCSCRYFSGRTPSAAAALLFALNPTAIAHAPMLLSDTFFSLLSAFTLFFFVSFAFGLKKDPFYYFSAVAMAALATLVRPVNLLFFVPMIAALWFIASIDTRKKIIYSGVTCLIFFAVLFPWVLRNHSIGAGWRLDASSVTTAMHNAVAVESFVTKADGPELYRCYEENFRLEFDSDPALYRSADLRMSHVEKEMTAVLLEHPFALIYLTCRPWVYLPDVPTLLENQGVTQSGRGTFDVLNREGIFAAVKHYFAGKGKALAATIPLLLTAVILYLAAAAGWIMTWKKKQWLLVFLLVGFGLYYTLITGPVQMPRYHLPVLPVLCLFAAIAFESYFSRFRKKD